MQVLSNWSNCTDEIYAVVLGDGGKEPGRHAMMEDKENKFKYNYSGASALLLRTFTVKLAF